MNQIMKMKYIKIYSDGHNHYIVHNTKKDFPIGHTHIDNFNTAKYVATLALHHKIPQPNHMSNYLIRSLIRISTDNEYITKLNNLLEEK